MPPFLLHKFPVTGAIRIVLSVGLLRQFFQCLVHLFKSALRIGIQSPGKYWDEHAGEALVLDEPYAVCAHWFDGEDVLAIEKSGNEKMPEPSQLLAWFDTEDRRSEDHARRTGGLEHNFDMFAHSWISLHLADERVPRGKPGEVGEESPYPFRRCLDLDFGPKFLHRLLVGSGF